MNKKTLIATATAVFAAASFATSAQAGVKCSGVNSCKGTSACKTASSACKGQGWTEASDAGACTKQGGKVLQ